MAPPLKEKALVLNSPHADFVVQTVDTPRPGPGEVLVRVRATSLNPIDWKIQKHNFGVRGYPAIIGIDPAGDIEELGEGVRSLAVGEKVFFQGVLENRRSAFQQYTLAKAKVVTRIPSNMGYEEVSTFPCAGGAAYLGLFESQPYGMGIPNPLLGGKVEKSRDILILGGSSSVGQYAIQFAKLAGFSNIMVTTSAKHTHHLKSLGATHVLDRNASPQAIRTELSEIMGARSLVYVFDTISSPDTQQLGYDLLASSGGDLAILLSDAVKEKVSTKRVNAVAVIRDEPENRKEVVLLYEKLHDLFKHGTIKPLRLEVLHHGLQGIPEGLKHMEQDKISGKKLVARPHETP